MIKGSFISSCLGYEKCFNFCVFMTELENNNNNNNAGFSWTQFYKTCIKCSQKSYKNFDFMFGSIPEFSDQSLPVPQLVHFLPRILCFINYCARPKISGSDQGRKTLYRTATPGAIPIIAEGP